MDDGDPTLLPDTSPADARPPSGEDPTVLGPGAGSSTGAGASVSAGGRVDAPLRIGRFHVLRRLGSGGMGVVYAAFDEDLDRKVAVKLLRPDRDDGESGRARLLREAQAMARLSHPNVIAVYEVGTFAHQVYVGMEFVDGEDLAQWQVRPEHSWREVVDAYVMAARGLAAAHEAGIVHRDFKPANALRGKDGRVRVLDFGLARGASEREDAVDESQLGEGSSRRDLLASPLTQTGTVMGTPAYMAPEQHQGRNADAFSDQFSFCVALYEALYGERPFAGKTLVALTRAVMAGELRPAPKYTQVPPRIRSVILRGLSVLPDERWPSMDELIDALGVEPAKRGRQLLGVGAVATLALAGALVVGSQTPAHDASASRRALEASMVTASSQAQARDAARHSTDHWNALVLEQARTHLGSDPSVALASLRQLAPEVDLPPATRTIAAAAQRLGVARRVLVFDESVRHMAFDASGRHLVVLAGTHAWHVDATSFDPPAKVVMPEEHAPITALAVSDEGAIAAVEGEDLVVMAAPYAPLARLQLRARSVDWTDEGTLVGASRTRIWWRDAEGELAQRPFALEEPASADARVQVRAARGGAWVALGERLLWVPAQAADKSEPSPIVVVDELGDASLGRVVQGRLFVLRSKGVQAYRAPGERVELEPIETWPERAGGLLAHLPGALVRVEGNDVQVHRPRGVVQSGRGHTSAIERLAVATQGSFATADAEGSVRIWDAASSAPLEAVTHEPALTQLVAAGDHAVLLGGERGRVALVSTRDGSIERLGQHTSAVRRLAVSPDGKWAASAGEGAGARLWNLAERRSVETLAPKGYEAPSAFAWSPTSERLAFAACRIGSACEILLSDLEGRVATLSSAAGSAATLAWLDDATLLVARAGHGGESLELVDVASGETESLVGAERERFGHVVAVAPAEDGRIRVASLLGRQGSLLEAWEFRRAREGDRLARFSDLHFAAGSGSRVVFQTAEDRVLTWDLHDQAVAAVGTLDAVVLAASDAEPGHVALRTEAHTLVVNLESGEGHALPLAEGPLTWAGGWVDAPEGLARVWPDLPRDDEELRAWLAVRTDAEPAALKPPGVE